MQEQLPLPGSTKVLNKTAFIVAEESRIFELVSIILEDLGFKSMQVCQTEWLIDSMAHVNPELVIWDFGSEKILSLERSLVQVRERGALEMAEIILLGGLELKNELDCCESSGEVHFLLKPFSPDLLRYEIEQLYGGNKND